MAKESVGTTVVRVRSRQRDDAMSFADGPAHAKPLNYLGRTGAHLEHPFQCRSVTQNLHYRAFQKRMPGNMATPRLFARRFDAVEIALSIARTSGQRIAACPALADEVFVVRVALVVLLICR